MHALDTTYSPSLFLAPRPLRPARPTDRQCENSTPSQKAVLAVQKQRNPPLPGQTPQQWLLQHYGIRTQATSTGHAQGGVGVSQPGMQSTSQAGAGGPQRSGFGTIGEHYSRLLTNRHHRQCRLESTPSVARSICTGRRCDVHAVYSMLHVKEQASSRISTTLGKGHHPHPPWPGHVT